MSRYTHRTVSPHVALIAKCNNNYNFLLSLISYILLSSSLLIFSLLNLSIFSSLLLFHHLLKSYLCQYPTLSLFCLNYHKLNLLILFLCIALLLPNCSLHSHCCSLFYIPQSSLTLDSSLSLYSLIFSLFLSLSLPLLSSLSCSLSSSIPLSLTFYSSIAPSDSTSVFNSPHRLAIPVTIYVRPNTYVMSSTKEKNVIVKKNQKICLENQRNKK